MELHLFNNARDREEEKCIFLTGAKRKVLEVQLRFGASLVFYRMVGAEANPQQEQEGENKWEEHSM